MQVNLPKVKLQYRQELQEALTSIGESINATETKHISGRNNINLTSIVKTDSRGCNVLQPPQIFRDNQIIHCDENVLRRLQI